MIEFNGEYGCMGDLGMHACHVPFRAGWRPRNVRAILSEHRARSGPTARAARVPVRDLGQRHAAVRGGRSGGRRAVPLDDQDPAHRARARRTPGTSRSWARGPAPGSRRKNPSALEMLDYARRRAELAADRHGPRDGLQDHHRRHLRVRLLRLHPADVGGVPLRAGRTASRCSKFAGCVTPEETALSHRLFTAALESQRGRPRSSSDFKKERKMSLLAGCAIRDISPTSPAFLTGYPHVPRTSTGVHDPLLASALYLADGRTALVLIGVDVLFVSQPSTAFCREAISRASGVPAENILISASHTHSGPVTNDQLAWLGDPIVPPPDPAYMERFHRGIIEAAHSRPPGRPARAAGRDERRGRRRRREPARSPRTVRPRGRPAGARARG